MYGTKILDQKLFFIYYHSLCISSTTYAQMHVIQHLCKKNDNNKSLIVNDVICGRK